MRILPPAVSQHAVNSSRLGSTRLAPACCERGTAALGLLHSGSSTPIMVHFAVPKQGR